MSLIKQVYGVGKSKLLCSPSGDAPERTFILPLTMQGGFNILWDDRSVVHELRSYNSGVKTLEEVVDVIDGFGNFSLDWSALPMPYSFVEDLTEIWNIRDRYSFKFYPKYEQYIGLPDLFFPVNVIGTEGLTFNTSDNILSPGTYGLKLLLRTTTNQKIVIGQATGTLQGGGSVNAPIEGGM